jgi:hypothetical protein
MRYLDRFFNLTMLVAALCACSKSGVVADLPSAAASYKLVTVERPENVEAFHTPYKAIYDMCAGMRKVTNAFSA